MVIGWVPVESDLSDRNQRVVLVWPNLRDIENIKSVLCSVFLWHSLHEPVPAREVALRNLVVEIVSRPFRILLAFSLGLRCGEVFDALACLVVVLDVVNVSFGIDPAESVRTVSVHVAVAIWCSAVAEQNRDLVKSLRRVRPKVKGHVRVFVVIDWVTLLRVNEVWELDGIFDEKHGGVVADHIVVAFFSVMFDRKSTWVSVAVVGTTFAGNC